jgi:hypothetical protein
MRTKTLALSALLGLLCSASVMAQNVYSVNAVGYINVTLYPGYNIITCPLICSPDNTIATLLNNSAGAYQIPGLHKAIVYSFVNGGGFGNSDTANTAIGGTAGWANNGTLTINPGQAVFFYNNQNLVTGSNMYATFVGTVPQNSTPISANFPNGMTNALIKGYNLVGSIVPVSGDLVTSPISALTAFNGDYVYVYDPLYYGAPTNAQGGYSAGQLQYVGGNWIEGDPVIAAPYEGFWYHKNTLSSTTNFWVENFSVNP